MAVSADIKTRVRFDRIISKGVNYLLKRAVSADIKTRVRFDRIFSRGVNYLPNKAVIADRCELDQYLNHLGLDATKPVLGISDKVTFKPISSATKTS